MSTVQYSQFLSLEVNAPGVENTRNTSQEICKSVKQTRANALVCLSDLQNSLEVSPVF